MGAVDFFDVLFVALLCAWLVMFVSSGAYEYKNWKKDKQARERETIEQQQAYEEARRTEAALFMQPRGHLLGKLHGAIVLCSCGHYCNSAQGLDGWYQHCIDLYEEKLQELSEFEKELAKRNTL